MDEFIKNLEDTLEKDKGSINSNDAFREFPEWDSLMAFAVLSMATEEYGVKITRAELDQLITVQDIYNFINNKA